MKSSHNKIDSLFMLTLAVYTTSLTSISLSVERQHTQSHAALILVALSETNSTVVPNSNSTELGIPLQSVCFTV